MLKQIGKNLRKERTRLNLRSDYVADKLGISIDTLYKIENGLRVGESLIKYLVFLAKQGGDLNKILDPKADNNE